MGGGRGNGATPGTGGNLLDSPALRLTAPSLTICWSRPSPRGLVTPEESIVKLRSSPFTLGGTFDNELSSPDDIVSGGVGGVGRIDG